MVRGEGIGVGGESQGDGGAAMCRCTKCNHWIEHKHGTPCNTLACSKCGAMMVGE